MSAAPSPAGTARRLWRYVRPMTAMVVVTILAVVIRAPAEGVLMGLLQQVLKAFFESHTATMHDLWGLVLLGVVIGAAQAITDFGTMFGTDYLAQRLVQDLRSDLFRRLQTLSLSYFEDASTGAVMSRVTNDINTIQSRLNYELARVVRCPLTIITLVGVMLWASWQLTLISFVVVSLLIPLISHASALMKKHTKDLLERLDDLTARLQESLAGIRVVQCFGATQHEIDRFELDNAEVRRASMRAVRVRAALSPLIHVVGLSGLIIVVAFGGYLVLQLDAVPPRQLFIVLGSAELLTQNFKQFGRARLAWFEVLTAASRIFAVIDTPSDIVEQPEAMELEAVEGRVSFDHVSFAYQAGLEVLAEVDLELSPGEAVAVVGPSGAGKSTLANLIPRLYDATSGRVLIDGHDVREVTLESLRRHIGIVPQETVLFRGTVRENIAYGRLEADFEAIREAAVAANADAFIRELPEGYDTEVGERGVKLSGGQAQRVAIARAILRDPRILILDEATSNLDSESEALVQEALERLMNGRTSLIIAHRLSTVHSSDRIIVLDHGRVVEVGSHEELMAADGHYRRAYRLQGGGPAG